MPEERELSERANPEDRDLRMAAPATIWLLAGVPMATVSAAAWI